MSLGFQKATREQVYVKVLLGGPSGSGKSYSAMRLATGIMQKQGGRIAYIDTEKGRAKYYANEFDFDLLELDNTRPEDYINAIDMALDAGYKTIVVDSTSHEWNTLLAEKEKMPGNDFTKWGKLTPRHDAFLRKMLESPAHIIATARGKDSYVLEEKNGKQVPKKVGVGITQRDGMEYEYTCTFMLSQDTHTADCTKDNTHLFEGRYDMLTEKDGVALYSWANDGDKVEPKPFFDADKAKRKIVDRCKELGGSSNANLMSLLKKYETTGNPMKITDSNTLEKLEKELEDFN